MHEIDVYIELMNVHRAKPTKQIHDKKKTNVTQEKQTNTHSHKQKQFMN